MKKRPKYPRDLLLKALKQHDGNVSRLAKLLEISSQSLGYAVRKDGAWCPQKGAKPLAKHLGVHPSRIRPDIYDKGD